MVWPDYKFWPVFVNESTALNKLARLKIGKHNYSMQICVTCFNFNRI